MVQRDVPRTIRNITPAIEALAAKGRALRSTPVCCNETPVRRSQVPVPMLSPPRCVPSLSNTTLSFKPSLMRYCPNNRLAKPPHPSPR